MKKRICKELSLLENNNLTVDNYIYYNNTIQVKLNQNFIVKLLFDKNFPFTRPKVFIIYKGRENEYINFIHLNYSRYTEQLNKQNKKCFCSMTIMCKNWYPSYKILDIINDIKNIKKEIMLVIYKSYLDIICTKNNIPAELIDLINNFIVDI